MQLKKVLRGRQVVRRGFHKPVTGGSIPSCATNFQGLTFLRMGGGAWFIAAVLKTALPLPRATGVQIPPHPPNYST